MELYSYVVFYPGGKIFSICGAVFDNEMDANDALCDRYGDTFEIFWFEDKAYYELISRTTKKRLHAQIVKFIKI